MHIKSLFIKHFSFFYIFFLILISFSVNQYYAFIGVLPVDSFSTFNAGYDILNGNLPFKDFWTIKGPVLDLIQAIFFKIFGISWFSYAAHASTFNSIFALATFFTLKKFNLEPKYCFYYSSLASILMYPTYGIPFTDHHVAIFSILAIYCLCLAIKLDKIKYWFFIPILLFLGFFTKQTPTAYFAILISLVSLIYFIYNFQKKIFILVILGSLSIITIFSLLIFIYEIPLDSILIQYFLYPVSLAETRLGWLFPLEFQKFVLRHKLIYLSLLIPIFFLFKNFFKNYMSIFSKDSLIFLLLLGTLLIFITHQHMTINGLFIFFLIPVFSGFSHLYSKSLDKKKYLINFFLVLSIVSTVYYHHKYISIRDTLLLRNVNLDISINASILDYRLKNLKWITYRYSSNPNQEIENLKNSIQIIKNDKRIKMIVTDYQFISVILSINGNSAARIWWRHHIYPSGPDQKYFLEWKKFLLNHIKKKKIEVIYSVHPLEGEYNIFRDLLNKECYSNEKLNKILVMQKLKNCDELNLFSNF